MEGIIITTNLKERYAKLVSKLQQGNIRNLQEEEDYTTFFDEDSGLLTYGNKVCFGIGNKTIANFGAIVTDYTIIHKMSETSTKISLLIYFNDEPPRKLTIDSLELNSGRWIDKASAKYCYRASEIFTIKSTIQKMLLYAPEKHHYLYSGWAMDVQNTYSYNDDLINASTLSGNIKDNCKFVIDHMLETAPHNITFPLIAYALLSLTQSKMKQLDESIRTTLILYGRTQSMKTTIATLFFNFENCRKAHINYEATLTAILRIMANRRDLPTIMDDCKPPQTSATKKELIKKTETILRANGDNNGGYQKADSADGTKSYEPQGLTVITAEDIPISVSSSIARTFIIEMNRQTVNKDIVTVCQINHSYYKDFITGYISYIAFYGTDKYCFELKKQFLEDRNTLFQISINEKDLQPDNRTLDTAVWLYIGFEKFIAYALGMKAVTKNIQDQYLLEMHNILVQYIEQQTECVTDLSEIPKFFHALRYLIDTKEEKIVHVTDKWHGYFSNDSKTAIGFRKNDYIYLKTEKTFQKVREYYKHTGGDYPISEQAFRKQLNELGVLELREVNKKTGKYLLTVRFTVNKEHYSTMMFKQSVFEKLLKGGKESDNRERIREMESNREEKLQAGSYF